MEADLQSLEERVKLLASQYKQMRDENIELRQSVLNLQTENKRLQDKVDTARQRVDALIGQLPEEDFAEGAEE
ncbi:MAG: hypothetical protein JO218_14360 [Burkholderiales bacterium]|nr:hypothetical protein [Burkholderiales bacterium]